MLFNSYEFIFAFLPIVFAVYFFLLHKRLIIGAKSFLVFSSLFFYSYWSVVYLPIILSSMLFNYVIGNSLNKNESRYSKKILLFFGIISNLILLGYFKYADFFINNFNLIFDADVNLLHLVLPLAISFFTFQQIAYLVDSYKQETKEYDFLNYSLFVTFFPQLIAGPIVHHKEMMPQFQNTYNLVKNYRNISLGLFIFSMGLFKKVVIADTFSKWANLGFDVSESLTFFEAWFTSFSYTFQLYFDFSGYTDMAIGLALLFNIRLPINFNSPYKALNIQDFWRRWHITLSRFLRDYVYIPLGGNKKGNYKTYNNLMATFLLGGFWHGAGWTFIFWGFLHGLALSIHRVWSNTGFRMYRWLSWLITFNFINIAWIFFRAKEWKDAMKVLTGMFDVTNIVLPLFLEKKISFLKEFSFNYGNMLENVGGDKNIIVWIVFGFILTIFMKNSIEKLKEFKPTVLNSLFMIILFVSSFLLLSRKSEFLYFNF